MAARATKAVSKTCGRRWTDIAMIRFVSALDVTAAGKLARGDAESDAKTDAESNA
jgi:hypothetical protein